MAWMRSCAVVEAGAGEYITLGDNFRNNTLDRGNLEIAVANRNDIFAGNDNSNTLDRGNLEIAVANRHDIFAGNDNSNTLDRGNLEIAVANRNDIFAGNDNPNHNNTLRHTAHREYILWRHAGIGARNRVTCHYSVFLCCASCSAHLSIARWAVFWV